MAHVDGGDQVADVRRDRTCRRTARPDAAGGDSGSGSVDRISECRDCPQRHDGGVYVARSPDDPGGAPTSPGLTRLVLWNLPLVRPCATSIRCVPRSRTIVAADNAPVSRATVAGRNSHSIRTVDDNTMNDSIGLYLNDIGKVPLLTAEDERELSRVIEAGREAAEKLANGQRGAALKARRRRRRRRQGPVHPLQPAPRRQHRPPLPAAPGHGPPRPHPGGQPRPRARRRQVRLAPRASSSRPTPRSGSARPSAGPSTRRPASSASPATARPACAPPCARPPATARPSTRPTPSCTASPRRCRSTRPSATTATPRSAT